MARCATVRTGCYGPRPLHGDARFDRPSRFKSRVPAQPFRMLLFHFASLKTAHAALLAVKTLRSNRRRHKSVRLNSCNDTGVERWHPGDIFRVGPSVDTSAIWTLSFFGHVRRLWRYISVRGNVSSQHRRLISQGAVYCVVGAAGC
jgi:hypothetical protein